MNKPAVQLADAVSGVLRGPLTESEAIEIAKSAFNAASKVIEVKRLEETYSHHEYRLNPLPAFAISFDHPSQSTVFISTELGTIQKIRNQKWRIFDFLWMMHTMDYEEGIVSGSPAQDIFYFRLINDFFRLYFILFKFRSAKKEEKKSGKIVCKLRFLK